MKSKIGWALSGPLPVKPAPTIAATATSVSEDKLASQLSKWWDIESYASKCDVFRETNREQSKHWSKHLDSPVSERYKVGLLWREEEVKLPINFYSAMGLYFENGCTS